MERPAPYKFGRIGGALCLDFTNTASWQASRRTTEHLNDFGDLLRWSSESGIIDRQTASGLSEEARRNPGGALTILNRARKLRELLYRIFVVADEKKAPGHPDLQLLNEMLAQAPLRFQVEHEEAGFSCLRKPGGSEFAILLGPVIWSAAELLASNHLDKVKQCASDTCGWLFLDQTKNRSRRWCDMADCGSKAKARRYYHRKTDATHRESGR
jgi:predicted RNA-binding Zn ribbon-like protein